MVIAYMLIAGLADRRRGRGAFMGAPGSRLWKADTWVVKPLARLGLGWAVCMAAGMDGRLAVGAGLLLVAGQLPSWEPIFAVWESRQPKPGHMNPWLYPPAIRRHADVALLWRGLLMGAPALLVLPWTALGLPVALGAVAGIAVAGYGVHLLGAELGKEAGWGLMEFIRGAVWALSAALLGGL